MGEEKEMRSFSHFQCFDLEREERGGEREGRKEGDLDRMKIVLNSSC